VGCYFTGNSLAGMVKHYLADPRNLTGRYLQLELLIFRLFGIEKLHNTVGLTFEILKNQSGINTVEQSAEVLLFPAAAAHKEGIGFIPYGPPVLLFKLFDHLCCVFVHGKQFPTALRKIQVSPGSGFLDFLFQHYIVNMVKQKTRGANMNSEIRDLSLAPSGHRKIEWVKRNMPLLGSLEKEFRQSKPFSGYKVALSIHLEAKTAYLCKVLAAGGAEMYITGSNPLSTQDDIAAALVEEGLEIHAWYNATPEEYEEHIAHVLEHDCNIIIDDGGDLVNMLHRRFPEKISHVIGGCEETTTGIIRLIAMDKAGELKFPMVLVNNADCKHLFDNRYGTGQSVIDSINNTTNLIIAGKQVVVAGYGWCGKGVAMRAKGMGAKVIVTEIHPVKALEAMMDGFQVMPMGEAAKIGDLFITVTGCNAVIDEDDFAVMKNGAILCNAGHFDVEVDIARLKEIALETAEQRKNVMGYRLEGDRWVYVIGEGRLVNLAAGNGHPAEIMDMSFAIQALSAKYLVEHKEQLKEKLIYVPEEVDREVAARKLMFSGISIDTLSPKQEKYLNSSTL
jgi:adenosylhomocysteinase